MIQLALTFRGLDQGGEVADEAAGVFDGGVEHDLDVGVLLHLFDQLFQIAPIVVTPGTGHQVPGLTAQFIALFHQVGLKTHVGDGEGRFHAGDPAADDQGGFGDRERLFVEGFQPHHAGHDAADQVLGFFQGLFRLVHMHPGVLVPDVGHIEEVGVEARLPDGFLEHGHVGPGAAGSHHHPVEFVFLDEIQDLALGVGGAGEQVLVGHRYPWQGGHVFGEGRDVDHAADVNAAVADEDADAGLLPLDIRLGRQLFDRKLGAPGRGQQFARGRRGRRGLHHRLGDILGTLKRPADKDPFPVGGHRRKGRGPGKMSFRPDVNSQFCGQFHDLGGDFQAAGEHHHMEFFRSE